MSTVYIVSVASMPENEPYYIYEHPILSFVFRLKKLSSQKLDEYVFNPDNRKEIIDAFADHNKPGLTTRDVMELLRGINLRWKTGIFIRQFLTEHRNTTARS